MRGYLDFERSYKLCLTCKRFFALKCKLVTSALSASLEKVFDNHNWCPSKVARSFKHIVRRMNTRVGLVDVAISGSTMVETILGRQCHNSDIDIYVTPDVARTVWAWLGNKLRLIFVDSKTTNHAHVCDRAHPGK